MSNKQFDLLELSSRAGVFQRLHFREALQHLAVIKQRMKELEDWGMYPGVAVEQWQSRNGSAEKNYLYMIFHTNRQTGEYEGPDGRQKIYVGNKEDSIREARQLNANRMEWNQLASVERELRSWLQQRESELNQVYPVSSGWPKYVALLGQSVGAGDQVNCPNEFDLLVQRVMDTVPNGSITAADLHPIVYAVLGRLSDHELYHAVRAIGKNYSVGDYDNDQTRENAQQQLERVLIPRILQLLQK